jgi:hypothetical protein
MDTQKKMMAALSSEFNRKGLSDPESMKNLGNARAEIKKSIQQSGYEPEGRKEEEKEGTTSGAAGVFVGPMSGEMKEKWSEKYKKSIDCKNPKGFSQRAHCQGKKKKIKESINEAVRTELAQLKDLARKLAKEKSEKEAEKEKVEKMFATLQRQLKKGMKVEMEHEMGLKKAKEIALDHIKENPYYYDDLEKIEKPKKTETKEGTSSASSGSYETPAFGAKSMKPKDWRGASKTQIPGGAFVQVKKKCKNFPYCNQGDINALKLTKSPTVIRKAKKLAEQYGVDESVIMSILIEEVIKNTKN